MNRKNLKTVQSLFITVLFTQINYAQTVTIGKQVWMTKNLNVDKFRNGDPIPEAKTCEEWSSACEKKQPVWCYYDNDPSNGSKRGKLYNWYAVNDPRGLAPNGYHIPTDNEWRTLENSLGGVAMAGRNLVEHREFSAQPAGLRICVIYHKFDEIGYKGFWWTSTDSGYGNAWSYSLDFGSTQYLNRKNAGKELGLSVRCLRD